MTSVGHFAFKNCTNLAEVTIPGSVMSIGNHAFNNCTSLAEVTIPDSVTSIGNFAFEDCTSLARISVPGHFSDQQVLDLKLPLECMIKRRELAILPVFKGHLLTYMNQSFNLVDWFLIRSFKSYVINSLCLTRQEELPFLPNEVCGLVLGHLRTVYVQSSKIQSAALSSAPDSHARNVKVGLFIIHMQSKATNSSIPFQ